MSLTRRSVCKTLALLPLGGLVSGCPQLVNATINANIFVQVTDKVKPCTVSVEGVPHGPYSEGSTDAFTSLVHDPFTVAVKQGSKVVGTKSVTASLLTNSGARTLAGSQLTVTIFESDNKVEVVFQFQPKS